MRVHFRDAGDGSTERDGAKIVPRLFRFYSRRIAGPLLLELERRVPITIVVLKEGNELL